MNRTRPSTALFLSVAAALAPAAGALGAFEIRPAQPTSCDDLTLVITRGFAAHCNWRVRAQITETPGEIHVELTPSGDLVCRQIPIDVTFEVPLGRFDAGDYTVLVTWSDVDALRPDEAELSIAEGACPAPATGFLRGDFDGDGNRAINDAVAILEWLFRGKEDPPCLEALDVNGQTGIDLADSVYLLVYLFLGGRPPPPPHDACGRPPDGFRHGCEETHCDVGGAPLWVASPDGCVQCQRCDAPTLEEMVETLVAAGIEVLDSGMGGTVVCLACDVCPSGRVYLVLVPEEDAERLLSRGWFRWEGEVP